MTLEGVQDNIILSGDIWFDETFYSVRAEDIVRKDNGDNLKGLSVNQLCVGVATDKKSSIILLEGTGKPSQAKTFEAFGKHIEQGSHLIHDDDNSHH